MSLSSFRPVLDFWVWSDTRPQKKTSFLHFSLGSRVTFFLVAFHGVIVFFAPYANFYARAEMNQRLLAWHGMKAGMDDERTEGRRWAEGGMGEGEKLAGRHGERFFHLLSLSLRPSVHDIR